MATFKAVILTGKGQTRADGFTNIKIKITQGRKVAYITTDLFIKPGDFKNGFATGGDPTWINSRIIDYLRAYTDRYLRIGDIANEMTVHEIRSAVQVKEEKRSIDFIRFSREYLKTLLNENKRGSYRSAVCLVNHLEKYAPGLLFENIDSTFLSGFEHYLYDRGAARSIPTYMARLRVIFNKGREKYNDSDRGINLIPNYPFKKFKIRMPKSQAKENALTLEQVQQLIGYRAVTKREELGRDVFLIMLCLMGLNSKDLFIMPKPVKGRVNYSRSKTGHKFSVKIEPELLPLVKKYSGEKKLFNFDRLYTSDQIFQANVNKGLKAISEAKGWKRVTTNWARHTVATLMRNHPLNISKDDVALCLGHKGENRVTDEYIKYDFSIQDNSNRKLINYIFAKPEIKSIINAEMIFSN